jgi:hypothetical protein
MGPQTHRGAGILPLLTAAVKGVQERNARATIELGPIYRPGPMQAEPVNLVRRGTEQP